MTFRVAIPSCLRAANPGFTASTEVNNNDIANCDNLKIMENKILIPTEKIDRAILFIRGQKVMIDSDLAIIYGVKTSRLNEQVK